MTNEYEVLQCFVSKLHFFVSKLMARDVLVWFTVENVVEITLPFKKPAFRIESKNQSPVSGLSATTEAY